MKLAPIEKVYEAWSAVADGRVTGYGDRYEITSSDGTKHYTVVYDPMVNTFYSDDNATFWRGYPGYPIIAVMMLRGMLPLDIAYANLWRGINWTELNKVYKRDYAAAVTHIEQERSIDPVIANTRAQAIMTALEASGIQVKRLTKKTLASVNAE